mgnify:FL=1
MNGYEATKAIRRSTHKLAKTIPIVAMTANAFSEDIQHSLAAGMDAHISKPVEMKVLKKTIRNIKFGEGGYRNAGHWIVINGFDATDAVERMNEVDADRYDLIFMDIQMPKMDGYMTTREIRTLKNNKKANIPIVAMTANVLKN